MNDQTYICAICLSEIANANRPLRLFCGHVFCAYCISEWFRHTENISNITCPLCRDHPESIPHTITT